MFYASSLCEIGASSSFIDSGLRSWGLPGLPGCKSLSFASPKESNQRKGDPQSGSLRFASGNLRCSKAAEFLETCRLCRLRTSKNFDPLPPALLSPARTGGGREPQAGSGSPHPCPLPGGEGVRPKCRSEKCIHPLSLWERARVRASPNPRPTPSPQPVLAGLEKAQRYGLKNLDVRRQRSWLVSKFSGSLRFFKEPQSGPDCGSPFLLLTLLLAKQKKSELLPGNPRQTPQTITTLKTARWQQEANK